LVAPQVSLVAHVAPPGALAPHWSTMQVAVDCKSQVYPDPHVRDAEQT